MTNLLNKSATWRAIVKLPRPHQIFLLLCLLATAAPTAAGLSISWTQIIVTLITVLLGGGGVFGLIKYALDFKLGKIKETNRVEEKNVDAAAELRDEYRQMLKELREEMSCLRERIAVLERYITDNNLPLPKMENDNG
jgi:hypothetical protein